MTGMEAEGPQPPQGLEGELLELLVYMKVIYYMIYLLHNKYRH